MCNNVKSIVLQGGGEGLLYNNIKEMNRYTLKKSVKHKLSIISRLPYLLVLLTLCITSCHSRNTASENEYNIQGDVHESSLYGETIILSIYNGDGTQTVDSTLISETGSFVFNGNIDDVCLAALAIENSNDGQYIDYHFFLENNKITVAITPAKSEYGYDYFRFTVKGSKADRTYRRESKGCYKEYPGLMVDADNDKAKQCLAQHSDAFYAPYLYYVSLYNYADYSDFIKQMDAFTATARNTYHYKLLTEKIPLKRSIAIGATIPDCTLTDTVGDTTNLHQVIAGKRYILVDFWASWCGPCRQEFGAIKDLYSKYAAQGFEVVAISIDEDPTRWKEALREEGLKWINMLDSEQSAKDTYGVNGVPRNFLIDSTGKILATNLHREMLTEKITKLMN